MCDEAAGDDTSQVLEAVESKSLCGPRGKVVAKRESQQTGTKLAVGLMADRMMEALNENEDARCLPPKDSASTQLRPVSK